MFLFLSMCYLLSENCYAADIDSVRLNLTFRDDTVKELVERVYDQSGYTLVFPDTYGSLKINGNFQNVTLSNLLSRVLKGTNYSLVIRESESLVRVEMLQQGSGKETANNHKGPSMADDYAELARISRLNEEKYRTMKESPGALDPLSGLAYEDINRNIVSAENKMHEYVSNESNVDPFSGETFEKINRVTRNNRVALNNFLSDPESVDPISGKKISELKEISTQRQKVYTDSLLQKPQENN